MVQSEPERSADLADPCVLILEPDILVRQPLAAYLRECGYRVCEALSVEETTRLLLSKEIDVNIVLSPTYANQPHDASSALASWVRANRPDVDMILTESVTEAAKTAHDLCEEAEAPSLPADHTQLLEKIRRALAARERSRN